MNDDKRELPADISVPFLITRTDYRQFCCDTAHLSGLPYKRVCRVLGLLLLATGTAGAVLLSHSAVNYLVWGFCLFAGLFFTFYDSVTEPFAMSRAAARDFDRMQSRLGAQTVTVSAHGVSVRSAAGCGEYPYAMLWRAVRTDTMFLFYLGSREARMLPLRALSPAQQADVAARLRQALGDRYFESTTHAPQK